MCGTVGLFTGCAALEYCPKAVLAKVVLPGYERGRTASVDPLDRPVEYRSPLANWDRRASVRAAPRRVLGADFHTVDPFPADLVPIMRHPLVAGLDSQVRRSILTSHLTRYLDFTAQLEYLVVNRAVLGIAHGTVAVKLPDEMRFDAMKIYCDEAYHALFSMDLRQQVTGGRLAVPATGERPVFLTRLDEIKAGLDLQWTALVDLLFVTVSETLISASLADVATYRDGDEAVRATIHDHAVDEGRHHAYFATFLVHLWGVLNTAERRIAGTVLPSLIHAFLSPEQDSLRAELAGYGMDREVVETILAEVYAPSVIDSYARQTAARTIGYVEQLDAFSDPAIRDAFADAGLLT